MRSLSHGVLQVVIILLGLLTAGGCSSFHREWDEMAAHQPRTGEPTGRWEGKWISEGTGHSGRLRAVVMPAGPGPASATEPAAERYIVHFHAIWGGIFRFGQKVEMTLQPLEDGTLVLSGQEDLGYLAGGLYKYSGVVTDDRFLCKYNSKHDHGLFRMQRK